MLCGRGKMSQDFAIDLPFKGLSKCLLLSMGRLLNIYFSVREVSVSQLLLLGAIGNT